MVKVSIVKGSAPLRRINQQSKGGQDLKGINCTSNFKTKQIKVKKYHFKTIDKLLKWNLLTSTTTQFTTLVHSTKEYFPN